MKSYSRATAAILSRSSLVDTPPVGFAGELRMTSLVRGVTRRRELVGVEPEAVLLADRAGHCLTADITGHGLVDREARVRVDDLVALVDQGQDGEEHDRLAAGNDYDPVWGHRETLSGRGVRGYGRAQLGNANRRRVVSRAAVQCPLCRLANVGRCIEVRFSDLEVDNRAACGLERSGSGSRLERGFGADAVHTASESHRRLLIECGARAGGRPGQAASVISREWQ